LFKAAVLLFVLGIALGLWLGFNPMMHEKVVQNWDHAMTFLGDLGANISTTIGAWTSRARTQVQVGQKTVSKVNAKPFANAWQQFAAAWSTFIDSLQRIWHELASNINLNKS
jgi:hypothetical protein